jgi:hypothetical protein
MRGKKPSEFFIFIHNIVESAGRVAKGAVNMDRADKKHSSQGETRVGEDHEGMVGIVF